ncbi:comF family protein [Peptacetobacter hiranonis DSM 13275]|uniref:ComF family protein n=2 Tax=Peptacetobacter TaxID=2743582 RepID=B6FVX8_PEPHT|nr:ComF family protein [Peptacetobacter hiranonis]EEA86324.1 comF family protein [Peptacetobacter hiranonis DSM 13275]
MDFFFPQNITCLICQKPIDPNNTYSLCKDCFEEMTFIKEECHKCGKPVINRINFDKSDDEEDNLADEDIKEIEDNCIILTGNNELKDAVNLKIDDDEEYILEKFEEYREGYGKVEEKKIEYSRCKFCENKNFYFDRAISCIEYCDKSKVLVLSLKYYGNTYMSRYIAQVMRDKLEFEQLSADYIIPVPLHKKRMRIRGFNQAEKIASYISEYTNIPIIDCVKRNRNTKRLYALNKFQREKELKNAFEVKGGSEKIIGKRIILVDDIFTTGTTVNEISKKLKIYGVDEIIVLTFLTRNID